MGNGSRIKPLTCGRLESGAEQRADDKVLTVFCHIYSKDLTLVRPQLLHANNANN